MRKALGLKVLAVFMALQVVGHLQSADALASPPYQIMALFFASGFVFIAVVDLGCALGFWFLKPWVIPLFRIWLTVHALAIVGGTLWFLATPPVTASEAAIVVSLGLVFGLFLYVLQRYVRSKAPEFT